MVILQGKINNLTWQNKLFWPEKLSFFSSHVLNTLYKKQGREHGMGQNQGHLHW